MLQNKRMYAVFFVMVILALAIGIAILGAAPGKSGSSYATATNNNPIKTYCTHPLDYWVAHPERYPPSIVIGDRRYSREQVAAILASPDRAQALLKQVLVTFLNTSTEGRQAGIREVLLEAYQWLAAHPAGSTLDESARLDSIRLVAALQNFNDGLAGLPSCEGPNTPTPTASLISTRTPTSIRIFAPTSTPTATLTPTFTPTHTVTPSGTPTPTATSTPTATRTRTRTRVVTRVVATPTQASQHGTPVRPTNTVFIPPTWTPTEEIIITTPPSDTIEPSRTLPPVDPSSTFTLPPLDPTFTNTVPPLEPTLTSTVPPTPNRVLISTPVFTAPAYDRSAPTRVVAARQVKLSGIFSVYIRMLENSMFLPKGR